MRKRFCKFLCVWLAVVLLMSLTSCFSSSKDDTSDTESISNTETESVENLETESETWPWPWDPEIETGTGTKDPTRPDYSLITVDGEHYLVFDNVLDHTYAYSPNEAWVMFDSIKEFKNTVTKGKLSDHAKAIIVDAFREDDIGFKICDFNNLFVPALPEDVVASTVRWSEKAYSFYIETDETAYGYITVLPEERYQKMYNHALSSPSNKTQYTLQSGDKICTVFEAHYSNGIPEYIDMYCTEGDLYYSITLSDLTEKPSEEWLLSFGLTPYVEGPAQ